MIQNEQSLRIASTPDPDDPRRIAATLWHARFRILPLTLLTIAIGALYAFGVATPMYRSSTVLILETEQQQIVDLQSVVSGLTGETPVVNSEVEVLRSRGLLGGVVRGLDLIDDPEFNPALRPESIASQIVSGMTGRTSPPDSADRQFAQTVDQLLDQTTVRNLPQSLVFRVTIETENPDKSARIADAIAEAYVQNQLQVKYAATEQATTWLSDRVAELQAELEAAEARVSAFGAASDLISIEALHRQEAQLKYLRERITQITDRPSDSQAQTQLAALQHSAEDLEAHIAHQNADLITLQQLTREAEASRLLYEHFLSRLKETAAQQGIHQSDSRILSRAVPAAKPSSPRVGIILILSTFIGLTLGAIATLLREARRESFRNGRELEVATGLPLMGELPELSRRHRAHPLNYLADHPKSAATEALRNLRTSLLLMNADAPPKVVMLASALPGEGKTTTSRALAMSMAALGKKTLLIEGDIRRQKKRGRIEVEPERHLLKAIAGDIALQQAVCHDKQHRFDVLGSDAATDATADLLSSDGFQQLMDAARQHYDMVIIDTPPVLVVPDARIIAGSADAILFVVRWNATTPPQVQQALRLLSGGKRGAAGLILNRICPRGMRRNGQDQTHGAYSAYGADYYVG